VNLKIGYEKIKRPYRLSRVKNFLLLSNKTKHGIVLDEQIEIPHHPMSKQLLLVIYVIIMIIIIVGVDVLFFRDQFWPRLLANIGIVLVFAALYFIFLK
jgi:hypothetical protein